MTTTSVPMNILETVVRGNFCSNCGICAAVCPRDNLRMTETEHGEYHPAPAGRCAESCRLCLNVCPFSNAHGQNEDSLGQQRFGAQATATHYDSMGWVRDSFVGCLADESERLQAASGGLATAVLCQLLKNGDIDAAIVLEPSADRAGYQFRLADTEAQILASRGSVYHVVPLEKVISDVLAGPERSYAVVALPCAAKAIRLAQNRLPALQRRLRYVLGLTCGGQRSLLFADVLKALMGRAAGRLRYRSKRYARNSHDYRAELATDRSIRSVRMLGMFGYLWINEVGGLQSCLFCDDVFAELADATFMDAWLPEYHADRRGTSLVISRNERLSAVLTELFDTGKCDGQRIAPEKIAQSQAGLLVQRRNLLAARCQLAEETLGYAPTKRLTLCPPYDRESQHADASRDLAFYRDLRNELLRYRERLCQRPGWLARCHAWRFCWRVLVLARRHGLLGRTFRATKYLT